VEAVIFDALQICCRRLWHDVVCPFFVVVWRRCIVVKRWEIRPRLLWVINRKSHLMVFF